MAKPRIFVSSTYYDLKHIRASLDLFIDSLGYEPVLSEKGDIAYTHDRALDESCYREAENSDIFVLIIGGRYGSEASGGEKKRGQNFFERYESITKKEYESAVARDIPIYVLIEKGVNSEYQTFLRNKEKTDINYAHVDSVNVFHLIEEILSKPRNNPIQTFEKFEEIETWLREQWAGLFRELMRRQSQQQQLFGLTTQVGELKEINETLKKYLEAVMTGANRHETSKLIESEEKRLDEVRRLDKLRANRWVRHMKNAYGIEFEVVAKALSEATNAEDFAIQIQSAAKREASDVGIARLLRFSRAAQADFNEARELVGAKLIAFPADDGVNDTRTREFSELAQAEPLSKELSLDKSVQSPPKADQSNASVKAVAKRIVAAEAVTKKRASPKKTPAKRIARPKAKG